MGSTLAPEVSEVIVGEEVLERTEALDKFGQAPTPIELGQGSNDRFAFGAGAGVP
jgi:hypothetical protein